MRRIGMETVNDKSGSLFVIGAMCINCDTLDTDNLTFVYLLDNKYDFWYEELDPMEYEDNLKLIVECIECGTKFSKDKNGKPEKWT